MKRCIVTCIILLITFSAFCQYRAIKVAKIGKGNPVTAVKEDIYKQL